MQIHPRTSYDGNIFEVDKEDIEVVPDKIDDAQVEGLKLVHADTLTNNEGQEVTNKEDGGQTSKPADKKPVQKCSNRALSGSQDGPVSYNKDVLSDGQKNKYPKDHISVHCVQRAGRRVLLMCSFDMLKDSLKMSDIYFHTDVTLTDGLTLQADESQVYPGTLTHLKLELPHEIIKICHALFPRVRAIQDFPYPSRMHLAHHINLQRMSDILPLWGVYVKYPLPTEWGTCAMATSISEKMGGPHFKDSLSPWRQTAGIHS